MEKTTAYEYAPTGQLSKVTDPFWNQTAYNYDRYGRLTSRTDPDLGTWTFTNDRLGQLVSQVDAKGQTINFTYDKLRRKTSRGEPSTVATWTWDTASKGIGKLANSVAIWPAGNVTRSYAYDTLSRLYVETLTYPGGVSHSLTTTYDSVSRPLVLTYPSTFAVKNVYNATGYLTEVRNNATDAVFWKITAASAAGVTEEDYGNGTGISRVFDPYTQRVNQLSAIRDSDGVQLQGFNYSYDPVGNIASRTETVTNVAETFAYDALNRLTIVNHVNGSVYKTFGYDDIGNLTYKSDVGSYTYPTTGKVHAVSAVPGATYTYDANGNLTNTGFANLTWTASNLPNVITAGAWNYTWHYDAGNNRVKYASPSETHLYFARKNKLLFETVYRTTTDQLHVIYANGKPVAQHSINSSGVGQTKYFYRDHLGSLTLIANESGTVTERLSYDAHGKRRFTNGTDDTGNTLFGGATDRGYTGHEHLDEIGLIHMNGRLYDPRLGRFVSADPLGEGMPGAQALNRFSYVLNNPFRYRDPTGYSSEESDSDDNDAVPTDGIFIDYDDHSGQVIVTPRQEESEEHVESESTQDSGPSQFSGPSSVSMGRANVGAMGDGPMRVSFTGPMALGALPPAGGLLRGALGRGLAVAPAGGGAVTTIALGQQSTLQRFASQMNAQTWRSLNWGFQGNGPWRTDFMLAMRNNSNRIVVELPENMNLAELARTNPSFAWELGIISRYPDWWSRITFYRNGLQVSNPFGPNPGAVINPAVRPGGG